MPGYHSFCLFFIFYNIHTFIQSHSHNTFIRRHSPGSVSISSSLEAQWEKPPCGAELRIVVCACWAYAEMILSHTEHTRKWFHRTLSIWETNFRACSANGNMWTVFTSKFMLSIRGTNFNAHWVYAERISSLAEHTRKCLKVEYLSWIEYYFQKFRVTGPWDHKVRFLPKNLKKCHACVPLISTSSS